MDKYDLIKDIKGSGQYLTDMIPLVNVKTEEDLVRYRKAGKTIPFTLEEFKAKFPNVDANNIYFRPSYMAQTIYFAKDKYIYKELPIYGSCEVLSPFTNKSEEEVLLQMIDIMNKAYENKNYTTLLYAPPDGLRFELFFKMIADKYIEGNEAYERFRDLYSSCEYGFNKFTPELIDELISYQTMEFKNELKERLSTFEDEVTIYRGEGDDSTSYKDGTLSWTLNINVANFFASRYSRNFGKILIAKVKKENIIDYIEDRDEDEVLVKPEDINVIDTIEFCPSSRLNDYDFLAFHVFYKYKNILNGLNFRQIQDHCKSHSLRVLFLALIIANELELTDDEIEVLAIASINHDRGRLHDRDCQEHGKRSYEMFINEDQIEELDAEYYVDTRDLDFLMTYHCKDDKEAIEYLNSNIEIKETREYLLKLLYILKDADALDRVRFGIRNLDLNYLRFDFSKKLTLIARLAFENLRL